MPTANGMPHTRSRYSAWEETSITTWVQPLFFISRSSHYEPIVSVRFIVLFNAVTLGFQSVSGIGTQRSVDFVSEGGRNDYPILIPKPQSEPYRLTFKRGYQMRKMSLLGLLAGYTGSQAIEAQGALGLILVLD